MFVVLYVSLDGISRLRLKDNDPLSNQICVYCNGKSILIVWVYIR